MRSIFWVLTAVACRSNTIVTEDKVLENEVVLEDADGDGFFEDEDCDDQNAQIHEGVEEICDGIDNNCNGEIDEGVLTVFYLDADGDGFGDATNSEEYCTRPDGYVPSASDCDDANANVFIGNNEQCDGIDNNCNDEIDEGVGDVFYVDADGDGFGDIDQSTLLCEPTEGYSHESTDCDDLNDAIYPGAEELCDGLDNNCDGMSDDANLQVLYQDNDGDGFGTEQSAVETCLDLEGYVLQGGDCDDTVPEVFPTATELCDAIDNNCDAVVDDDATDRLTWYIDADSDGYGNIGQSVLSCGQPTGYVSDFSDCDDTNALALPTGVEICDGFDNDCDGLADDQDPNVQNASTWYLDADVDGFGLDTVTTVSCLAPPSFIAQSGDCNDLNASISPNGIEVCDEVDNNCDGQVDEGVELTFYYDFDGDGYGVSNNTVQACEAPTSYVDNADDCNDTVPEAYSNAIEVCDGIDNDFCDGIFIESRRPTYTQ